MEPVEADALNDDETAKEEGEDEDERKTCPEDDEDSGRRRI